MIYLVQKKRGPPCVLLLLVNYVNSWYFGYTKVVEVHYTMPYPPYTIQYTLDKTWTTRSFMARNGSKWELANQIWAELSLSQKIGTTRSVLVSPEIIAEKTSGAPVSAIPY